MSPRDSNFSPGRPSARERNPVRVGRRSRLAVSLSASLVLVIAALFATLGTSRATCDDAVPQQLQYRQIFVPEDEISKLPGVYVPVKRSEFKELLSAVRARQTGSALNAGARLEKAFYSARFENGCLCDGTARLEIVHSAERPVYLPLKPCRLAITEPHWHDAAHLSDQSLADPFRNSTLAGNDSGETVTLVEASGELRFSWSLRGQEDPTGTLDFQVGFPACPVAELQLDLPAELKPEVDYGIVVRSTQPPRDDGYTRWRIAFNSRSFTRLRLLPIGTEVERERVVLLRQLSDYRVSTSGVELSLRLNIDVFNEPLEQLAVSLSQSLKLLDIQYGGKSLPWNEERQLRNDRRNVVIEFPQPLTGAGREIVLTALAPLTKDEMRQLPYAQVNGVDWQEGEILVAIQRPLVVQDFRPKSCAPSDIAPLPRPAVGQQLRFRCFGPAAAVAIHLATDDGSVVMRAGRSLQIGEDEITASVVADFTSTGRDVFTVTGILDPAWSIETIETEPREVLDQWTESAAGGQRTVRITLNEPIREGQVTRLALRAKRLGTPVGTVMHHSDLRPIEFSNVTAERRLVSIDTDSQHQVRVHGGNQLVRISPDELALPDSELVDAGQAHITYVDDSNVDDLGISLSSEPPHFAADFRVSVQIDGEFAEQRLEIRCTPESSSVRELSVLLFDDSGDSWQWTLNGQPEPSLGVSPLATGEPGRPEGAPTRGWHIVLPKPTTARFSLSARRTVAFADRLNIPLVSIPLATAQFGKVQITRQGDDAMTVDAQGLKAIVAQPAAWHEFTTTVAAFRYDPLHPGELSVVRVERSQLPRDCWIWNAQLTSKFGAAGTAMHEVHYQLENTGANHFELLLPSETRHVETWVEDQAVSLGTGAVAKRNLRIPLPKEVRFPRVVVRYAADSQPLGFSASVVAPWPKEQLSVLARQWHVWLPPGVEISDSGEDETAWTKRLFGNVARTAKMPRSNPFSLADWRDFFAALTHWNSNPSDAKSGSVRNEDEAGWTRHHVPVLEFVDEYETSADQFLKTNCEIHRPAVWQAFGWLAFLIVVALTVWLSRANFYAPPAIVVLTGCWALLGSAVWLPVATMSFLGAACASLLILLLRQQQPRSSAQPLEISTEAASSSQAVAIGATLLLIAGVPVLCNGQQATVTKPAAQPQPVHPVLNPTDEKQEPTGEYVFLTREFYDGLYRRVRAANLPKQHWIIHSARYDAALSWNVADSRLGTDLLRAAFQIEVFRSNSVVRLPMSQATVFLVPDLSRLDGQTASVQWADGGDGLLVEIGSPGRYLLELAFRPKPETEGQRTLISLATPIASQAILHLNLPADAMHVDVPSAIGGQELLATGPGRLIWLGPADRLTISWPATPDFGLDPTPVEVDQAMWLNVRPSSVVLEAKLKFTSADANLRQIQLRTDPRLRMLPMNGKGDMQVHQVTQNDVQTIFFNLPPPYERSLTIDVSFLLSGATGIGRINLPRLEPIADRVKSRHLAVSVGGNLSVEIPPDAESRQLEPAQFAQNWREGAAPPNFAFDLSQAASEWHFATRPVEPQVTARQKTRVRVGRESAIMRFDADLEIQGGPLFRQELIIPQELTIENISMRSSETELVSRWSRTANGRVVVLFNDPVTSNHKLVVRGKTEIRNPGRVRLPIIAVSTTKIARDEVEIFHEPDVRVKLQNQGDFVVDQNASIGSYKRNFGRLVAALNTEPEKPAARRNLNLSVSNNNATVDCAVVTSLYRDGDDWRADVVSEYDISGGTAGVFRFDVSPDWEPSLAEPEDAEMLVVSVPKANRRQVTIRPSFPVSGTFRLRLTGKLLATTGDRVRAPDVMPLDVSPATERYLVAPKRLQSQQIAWETSGFQTAQLPERFAEIDAEGNWVYMAVGNRLQAVITDVQIEAGKPSIPLAEIHAALADDGSVSGMATFDLEPAGLTSCTLKLPNRYRLIAVQVADRLALARNLENQTWEVPLATSQLPQRIRVVFESQTQVANPKDLSASIPCPKIVGIPVEETILAVVDEIGANDPGTPAREMSAEHRLEIVRLRLEVIAGMIERAATVGVDSDPTDVRNWYLPWARRFVTAKQELERLLDMSRMESLEEIARLSEIDLAQERVAQRLNVSSILQEVRSESESIDREQRPRNVPAPRILRLENSPGSKSSLEISASISDGNVRPFDTHTFVAICLTVLGVVWIALVSRENLRRWFVRHAWVIGIFLGLGYWLWCEPSMFGIVLAAGCVLVAIAKQFRFANRRIPVS